MTSITINKFKKIFHTMITDEKKYSQLIYQDKHFKSIRKYLYNYAEKKGFYFVELDEFTLRYIEDVAELYAKMSENDYCIIYVCLPNIIDYNTPSQRQALRSLAKVIKNETYNMQIVVDIHCVDSDTPKVTDIKQRHATITLATILHTTMTPLDICYNSYIWHVK